MFGIGLIRLWCRKIWLNFPVSWRFYLKVTSVEFYKSVRKFTLSHLVLPLLKEGEKRKEDEEEYEEEDVSSLRMTLRKRKDIVIWTMKHYLAPSGGIASE